MPLDPAVVEMLHRVGGPGLIDRLIAIFLEHTPNRLREIRAGVERHDLDHVAHWAHSLRSSSVSLGVRGLVDVAERLEKQALENDATNMKNLVGDLEHAFEVWKRELEEWSGDRSEVDDRDR